MDNLNAIVRQLFDGFTDAMSVLLETHVPVSCEKCRVKIPAKENLIEAIGELSLNYKSQDKINAEIEKYNEEKTAE